VNARRLLTLAALACLLPIAPAHPGDAAKGERVFQHCYSCHSVIAGENKLQGPNLRGVIGRRAGTLPGFEFSPAMIAAGKERGIVWNEKTLDAYLVDPEAMIPGTLMGPVRLEEEAERQDLIAYLKKSAE
jgi:cytochrome c